MSEKLQLHEIAGYLPYGLKCRLSHEGMVNLDSEYPNEHQHKVGIIKHFSFYEDEFSGSFWVTDKYSFDFEEQSEIEIILRPMSDLTKEITHNGETFIPLVELYKISKGCFKDRKVKYVSVMATNQIMVEMEGYRNYFFGIFKSEGDVRLGIGNHFRMYSTNLFMADNRNEEVEFQDSLFQKLHELHFDIHNLIGRGLAIDINTLKD